MFQFSCLVVLYSVCILVTLTEAKVDVSIANVTATSNPKYLTLKVDVRKTSEGLVVDIDSDLKEDIGSNIQLWIDIQTKNDASGYDSLFKSDNLEVCVLMESAKEHPLAMPLLEKMNEHGNIPQSCPVKKGHYQLKGFFIDGAMFPSFIPSGIFRLNYGVTNLLPGDVTVKMFEMQWDVQVVNDQ